MAKDGCGKQGTSLVDRLSDVVADIPPAVPTLRSAVCRTPTEFLAHRRSFGNPTYAVQILEDDSGRLKDTWFFSSDLQEAVAIGMRWHERGCRLEQYPEEQSGEIVYGYHIKNFSRMRDHEYILYMPWLWDEIREDVNAKANPKIMTRLRMALFEFLVGWSDEEIFLLLDFSRPDGEAEYLKYWADELEG